MAFSVTSFLLHCAATACFGYAIYYDVVLLHVPESRKQFLGVEYAGRWKYLTFWNAVSTVISENNFSKPDNLTNHFSYDTGYPIYLLFI